MQLQGDRADHQEGARCRADGHRARHAARSDGCGHATFATDNLKAGKLIGDWAKGTLGDKAKDAKIVFLDLATNQPTVDYPARPGLHEGLRHRRQGSQPLRRRGRSAHLHAMKCPTATRPRAAPRWRTRCRSVRTSASSTRSTSRPLPAHGKRSRRAGKDDGSVLVVSIDGGCPGVKNVEAGVIGATSQQYPHKMASMALEAIATRQAARDRCRRRRLPRHRRDAHHRQAGGRRRIDLDRGRPEALLGLVPFSARNI